MLKFRPHSKHSVCLICDRLKAQMRHSSNFVQHATAADNLLGHLKDTWQCRQAYWNAREVSRGHQDLLCLIFDGMDKSKPAFPRWSAGRLPKGAVFERINRTHVAVSACLAHGYGCFVFLSEEGGSTGGSYSWGSLTCNRCLPATRSSSWPSPCQASLGPAWQHGEGVKTLPFRNNVVTFGPVGVLWRSRAPHVAHGAHPWRRWFLACISVTFDLLLFDVIWYVYFCFDLLFFKNHPTAQMPASDTSPTICSLLGTSCKRVKTFEGLGCGLKNVNQLLQPILKIISFDTIFFLSAISSLAFCVTCCLHRLLETKVGPVFEDRGEFFKVVMMDKVLLIKHHCQLPLLYFTCPGPTLERDGAQGDVPWQRLSAQERWRGQSATLLCLSSTQWSLGLSSSIKLRYVIWNSVDLRFGSFFAFVGKTTAKVWDIGTWHLCIGQTPYSRSGSLPIGSPCGSRGRTSKNFPMVEKFG